jgi:hypothetical protein
MKLTILHDVVPVNEITRLDIVGVNGRDVAERERPVSYWSPQGFPDANYLVMGD